MIKRKGNMTWYNRLKSAETPTHTGSFCQALKYCFPIFALFSVINFAYAYKNGDPCPFSDELTGFNCSPEAEYWVIKMGTKIVCHCEDETWSVVVDHSNIDDIISSS